MKKKRLVIVVLLLVVGLGIFFLMKKEQKISHQEPVFWVLSDTHLLEKSMFDDGTEFERVKLTSAGKDLEYQEENIAALVDLAIKEQPTGVIITGDLTLNGEKRSAEKLAELLQPLEENNVDCYVIPGNHDINDGWARTFRGDKAYKTEQINAKDFETIFSMSYKAVKDKDKDSLSYVIDVNDELQFLMLDTNIYGKLEGTTVPQTKGRLKDETLTWLKKHLEKGKTKNKKTILFMHHNLLKHNELIYEGFVLENTFELQQIIKDYEVPLVFSGHTHTQSIKENKELAITEIVSASYAITEQIYGEVTFSTDTIQYEKKRVDVDTWAKKNQIKEPNVLNYRQFTKDLFVEDGQRMAYGQLIENGLYDEEKLDQIAFFVGEANWQYFTGNNDFTKEEITKLKSEPGYKLLKEEAPFLADYMDSVIKPMELSNNQLTIKLK